MTVSAATAASLPRKSAGGAFWVMLEGGVAQVLALVFFAIIARLTDPHAYGLVAVSLALLETLRAVFVDILATVLTSNRLAQQDDWDGAYWATIVWCLVLTILSAAVAPFVAWALGVSELAPVLQLLSLNFLLYGVGRVPEGYLNQQMRFRPLAVRTVCAVVIGGVCGVVVALRGGGVYALIVQQLVMPAVSSALVLWFARWRPSLKFSSQRLRKNIGQASKLSPNALAYVVSQNLDVIVVGALFGASTSGLYNLARRLRLAAQMVFLGLGRVALSAFTSLDATPDRIGPSFVRGAQFIAMFAAPAFVGVVLVGDELITLMFGEKWRAAAPLLGILMLAGPVLVFNDYLEQLLISRRRLSQLALAKLFYIALLAVLLFSAARFGWRGVAWASTISAALLAPIMLRIARRAVVIDLKALGRVLAPPAAACAVMAVVVLILRPEVQTLPEALRLLILIPAGAGAYVFALWLFARDAVYELAATGINMAPNLRLPAFTPPDLSALIAQAADLSARTHALKQRLRGPAREVLHLARRKIITPLLPSAPQRAFPAYSDYAVCGLLSSSSGLGKSARLCVSELQRLGYRAYGDDVSADYGLDEGMDDRHVADVSRSFSGVKIWHLNPPMLLPTIIRHAPQRFFKTYNIAYWAWEFDVIPDDWIGAARMMDAVLTTSTFVADALRQKISTPVFVVHHPVEEPASLIDWRARLCVAADDFVVHLVYNYGSSFERKNPLASIEAFLRAFPSEKNAKLIIKTAQSEQHPEEHRKVREALCGGGDRIKLIDAVLNEQEVLSLIACSDALISLHRSEGFGLPMAEAMYLGVPVVATRWSGNLDFCTPSTSLLVDAALTPARVKHAHLAGLAGARWADPDSGHAATLLRTLYENPALGRNLAFAAGREIRRLRQTYSYDCALAQLRERG